MFICGVPRSGTTLLTRLLDGHPSLAVLPWDTQVRSLILERPLSRLVLRASSLLDRPELPGRLAAWASGDSAFPDRDALAKRLARWLQDFPSPPGDPEGMARRAVAHVNGAAGAWEAFFSALADVAGREVLTRPIRVEKTPYNEGLVSLLDALFGAQTRYVHLVRDPRAVIGSWTRMHAPAAAARASALLDRSVDWARSLDLARHHLRVRPDRYAVLRYEDLVADPHAAMEGVRVFLDLMPHPALESPTHLGAPALPNSSYEAGSDAGVVRLEPTRWTRSLAPEEVARIEAWLGPQMRTCGYSA
ncbi:MAG: sulfotransferase, partial [Gemmatimonadota bacterium]